MNLSRYSFRVVLTFDDTGSGNEYQFITAKTDLSIRNPKLNLLHLIIIDRLTLDSCSRVNQPLLISAKQS